MSFTQTCKPDVFNVKRLRVFHCFIFDCNLCKSYSLYTPVWIVNNISERLKKPKKETCSSNGHYGFSFPRFK